MEWIVNVCFGIMIRRIFRTVCGHTGARTERAHRPTGIRLWLDDVRDPNGHGAVGFIWVKTFDEAVTVLMAGNVTFASLDHDLAEEHYPWSGVPQAEWKEKSGYDVVRWMEKHRVWPVHGVAVHSMNPVGRKRMRDLIDRHYVSLDRTIAV